MYNEYNEVIEILNYIPKKDFDRIPKNMIDMFKAYMNPNYHFKYDTNKTLQEQEVSKEARTIISILYRDYWATTTQKEKILQKEKYDLQKKEELLREKYNTDNLFKNKNAPNENYQKNNVAMVQYKDSLFKRILNKIEKFFKKK